MTPITTPTETKTMLKELANQLAIQTMLEPGQCCEVHVCEGQASQQCVTSPREFIYRWRDFIGQLQPTKEFERHRWLGVVHEDGALLMRIGQ